MKILHIIILMNFASYTLLNASQEQATYPYPKERLDLINKDLCKAQKRYKKAIAATLKPKKFCFCCVPARDYENEARAAADDIKRLENIKGILIGTCYHYSAKSRKVTYV